MPINKYFDVVFGVNGNLTAVPDGTQVDGSISYNQGWPVAYSTPVGSGGLNISRAQTNQLFFDVTSAIQNLQQGSPPAFITTTMNGGTPYSYPAGAIVSSAGTNYQSLVGSNTTTPPGANWAIVVVGTKLLAANNLSDVISASTSLSNLGGLSSATAASTYAPLASPAFTGTPSLPTGTTGVTQSPGNSTTKLATTAFVGAALGLTAQILNIQEITSTGTYTPTSGMLYCVVINVGGGGGGGGSSGSSNVGAGGGSGGVSIGVFSAATIGASQSVTIGAGGTAGSSGTGGTGGTTTLGALLSGTGGVGGAQGASVAILGGVGGTGSGGIVNFNGNAGQIGGNASGASYGGQGANSPFGAGGNAIQSGVGNPGLGNGSGGGGGSTGGTNAGGAGTKGIVVIIELAS